MWSLRFWTRSSTLARASSCWRCLLPIPGSCCCRCSSSGARSGTERTCCSCRFGAKLVRKRATFATSLRRITWRTAGRPSRRIRDGASKSTRRCFTATSLSTGCWR
uniref:(northern house mosquito) hypothetical protein n=1 Tax=Culex pipiens TaxID=7175 RepID=A0A8D8FHW2_CULPI